MDFLLLQDLTNRTKLSKTLKRQNSKNEIEHVKEKKKSEGDYIQEMYTYFSSREGFTSVRPLYMEEQDHLNESMRAILVDWLIEVHCTFHLAPATLFLCINIVDRYLEHKLVYRQDFQLVGVTALWIASKYEDIQPIPLKQVVDVCVNAYTKKQIFEQERQILEQLQFHLSIPTSLTFLFRFLKVSNANKPMAHLSMYILEGTLASYTLLHYLPSQMAAAAVYIARQNHNQQNPWSPALTEYTGYTKQDILPVAKAIWNEKKSSNEQTETVAELTAVQRKYSSERYSCVANMTLRGV